MKSWFFPVLIALMAALYLVIPSDPLPVKVIFKLIPMILIMFYARGQVASKSAGAIRFILIGLVFCTLGDAFIAVSFVAGLGAFLVGHVFYCLGFFKVSRINKWRLAAIIPIALYSFTIGSGLISALRTGGEGGLVIPVIAYMVIISLMAFSAMMTGNRWAISGSILFVLSDSILSWNMFVAAVPYSDVLIMSTYYSAQFLIASSLAHLQQIKERIV
ncbi:lysoplasmalogenase [Rossellomorea sp. SC111]|uniref:lysoplasmalogenase n=1 Tax=Rossellomorea sp. SC111 TaxID=2968985 RepID=UPI00215B094E|nr:lysoplasmalogenase [Rossellomorea sp. SC111]MCR8848004.1 lysoplasmalogenase [Rossellomorea sp. SC111]